LIQEHNLPAHYVSIDAGGGGKQIADRLGEQGFAVQVVSFAESPDSNQAYKNRRAEMYGMLRNRLHTDLGEEQFVLPPDAGQLRHELSVLPLMYDSEGKYVLPPKRRSATRPGETSIEKLLGRS
jgi:hypothetical protein